MHKTTMMLMALLLAGLPGFAQTISGSIAGRVVDAQGGVVPNAAVTITEPSKKLRVSTKSSAGGDFLIPGLLPGDLFDYGRKPGLQEAVPDRHYAGCQRQAGPRRSGAGGRRRDRDHRCFGTGRAAADGKRRTVRDHQRHADFKHRSERSQSPGSGQAGSRRSVYNRQ